MEGVPNWAKHLEALSAESPEVVEKRLRELEQIMRARLDTLWNNNVDGRADE